MVVFPHAHTFELLECHVKNPALAWKPTSEHLADLRIRGTRFFGAEAGDVGGLSMLGVVMYYRWRYRGLRRLEWEGRVTLEEVTGLLGGWGRRRGWEWAEGKGVVAPEGSFSAA